MLEELAGMVSVKTGPGKALLIAERFGLLNPMMSLVLSGLRRAPAPTKVALGDDWIKNIDVFAHGMGCVVVGTFDDIVEGMDVDELRAVTPSEFAELAPPGWVRGLMEESFDICRQIYLEKGELVPLVQSGEIPPEGLITQAMITPLVRKSQTETSKQGGGKSKLGSILSRKKTSLV